MATGVSIADFIPFLKEHIEDPTVINELIYGNQKFLGLLEKDESASGKWIDVPVTLSGSQGISPSFDAAYRNQSSGEDVEFQVPLGDMYGLLTVQLKTWRVSKDKKGAFGNALETKLRSTLKELGKRIGGYLYRSGTGTIGKIASITAGVITLVNPNDVQFFDKDMVLQAYTTNGGGGTALAAYGYVVGTDPNLGTVGVSGTKGGAVGTPASWSVSTNPYLVEDGSFDRSPPGLLTWLPIGSDRPVVGTRNMLYNVDRSASIQKLCGTYKDMTVDSSSIEEAVIKAIAETVKWGGEPDIFMIGPDTHTALEMAMQGRTVYKRVEGPSGVGYNSIVISSGGLDVSVMSDMFCPNKIGFALQTNTWKLSSVGKFPGLLDTPNGEDWITLQDKDAVQRRLGGHAALRCNAPGANGVFKLPA